MNFNDTDQKDCYIIKEMKKSDARNQQHGMLSYSKTLNSVNL